MRLQQPISYLSFIDFFVQIFSDEAVFLDLGLDLFFGLGLDVDGHILSFFDLRCRDFAWLFLGLSE